MQEEQFIKDLQQGKQNAFGRLIDDDYQQKENFLLIDKNKHIRGIYNGLNRASLAKLIIDVGALKKETNVKN